MSDEEDIFVGDIVTCFVKVVHENLLPEGVSVKDVMEGKVPDVEAEEAYADGTFDVKGFLFAYQILFSVIRLVIDKECRRMYNKYKK